MGRSSAVAAKCAETLVWRSELSGSGSSSHHRADDAGAASDEVIVYLLERVGPICVPMISPETTSSTRRFCWRPEAVVLLATGLSLPKPRADTLPELIPSPTR